MRESTKGERSHLPAGVYEEWLKSQSAKPKTVGRGKEVPHDTMEAWVTKRVERKVRKVRRKTR